ncbi:M23 family metallopeptidase [Longivirga aurantiaca]|uniref:M23 family metallopeptidase n=1 Tax=Longivirga aurantiaca TaxID=1837743 RepID=A0ABW1SWJ2_9ACTN
MPGPRAPFSARYGLAVAGGCAVLALTGAGLAAAPPASVQAEPTAALAASFLDPTRDQDELFSAGDAAVLDPAPQPKLAMTGAIRSITTGAEIQAAIDHLAAKKAWRERKAAAERKERADRLAARKRQAAARAARAALYVSPVPSYQLSAAFGARGGWSSGRHTGLDFRAPTGTPVVAVHDARVAKTAWHPAYGRMIILDLGNGVTTWYCHLSQVSVRAGERVSTGERIGAVGTSGNTSGPHLHFEVRLWDQPTDPATFLWGSTRGRPGSIPGWTQGTVQPYETLGQYSF